MKDRHNQRFLVVSATRPKPDWFRQSLPQIVIITLVLLGGILISYSRFTTKIPTTPPSTLCVSELYASSIEFLKDIARKCNSRKFSTINQLNFHLKHKFSVNHKNAPKYDEYFSELLELLKKGNVAGSVNQYVEMQMQWARNEGRDLDFEDERITGKTDQWNLDGLAGNELIFFLSPDDHQQEMHLTCRLRTSGNRLMDWIKKNWWKLGVANGVATIVILIKTWCLNKKLKRP